MLIGHSALLPGPGQVDVGIGMGFGYERSTTSADNASSSDSGTLLSLPAFEGNILWGLGEQIGLNLHVSEAGIQPGVQIQLLKGPVSLAVLPEIAFGYMSGSGGSSSSADTSGLHQFDILAGAKVLLSHESGVYGGVGYDFQYLSVKSTDSSSDSSDSTETASIHNVTLGLGFATTVGNTSLRPELAFLFYPGYKPSSGSTTSTTSQSGWVLMPTITIAATTDKH